MCYTHFYTISLLCKSYGYVIIHRYNETITSNNCCGNIVFNMCYIRRVQTNSGMRLGFGQNSGKFYDTIDSNPIQHRRF